MSYDTYTSPLASRNASDAMLRLWSPRHKFNTWRRIWLAVADAQHELTCGGTGVLACDVTAGGSVTGEDACATPRATNTPPLVTKDQLEELRAVVNKPGGITDAEMKSAEKYERELRHDVMAHVHALGDSAPKAKGIIHLGMTSQDVVCNADLMTLGEALKLTEAKVTRLILTLGHQAATWKSVPTLGFTHYQPAQPVTVGRRIAMWANDLQIVFQSITNDPGLRANWYGFERIRGLRGATGTQASYLALFEGDGVAVDELEARFILKLQNREEDVLRLFNNERIRETREHSIAALKAYMADREAKGNPCSPGDGNHKQLEIAMRPVEEHRRSMAEYIATNDAWLVPGQTYSRVVDTIIISRLASFAAVLHKIATDIRLLSNRKEIDEPFESKQIGSSAMPYKRNPMRCERICGLTRFVMNLVGNAYDTAATQWLERTLDDSSNRRLSLPEAFLALDGALDLMHNVASGLIVHEAMVRKNLMAELPFMATENILMACVKTYVGTPTLRVGSVEKEHSVEAGTRPTRSVGLPGDRQFYHELIRQHAQAAGLRVKQEGLDNDLLERLKADKHFWSTKRGGPLREELDWDNLLDPMKYIGRSVEQTERFIKEVVEPLREQYKDELAKLEESSPKV